MARKLFIAGNWKMNKTVTEALELVSKLKAELAAIGDKFTITVCPPFTALDRVCSALKGSNIAVGAQNLSDKASGAYTGEVSAAMLLDLGVKYVIVGHSERRQYYGETDKLINKKAKFAISAGLYPILCLGETLEERESGKTKDVVSAQFNGCFEGFSKEEVLKTTIAYEPVWAIGTGKTASPKQAQEVHGIIRKMLANKFDAEISESVIIQYGGSIKADNSKELMSQKDIDGGLVGGASLDAAGFVSLIKNAMG